MRQFIFSVEDYILYILNNLEPEKSDKIKLNKIAFFVEFTYIFYKQEMLSNANYAAIKLGPVVDNYAKILDHMADENIVKIDNYKIRPLQNPSVPPPEEIANFIDPLIEKYSQLTNGQLIALSHKTDSWLITTNNEKTLGSVINKDLASLESFFAEEDYDESCDEEHLPEIDKGSLKKYELN